MWITRLQNSFSNEFCAHAINPDEIQDGGP